MDTTRRPRPSVWTSTWLGRFAKFIGSVRFAVPALALATLAMIWGTWLESTQNRKVAAELVYGAWWFELLMGGICASLILSVAVRYPWKPKHTGFIIVHASLISLIAVGFYTMYTKIEARVILGEGERTGIAIMDDRWVELVEPDQWGGHRQLAAAEVFGEGPVEIVPSVGEGENEMVGEPIRFEILDVWANSEESFTVRNDGRNPFHAIEIAAGPDAWVADRGDWLGQLTPSEPAMPGDGAGFAVRVVPLGETWTPPSDPPAAVLADDSGNILQVGEPGEPLADTGWTVRSVERLRHATIGETGLVERAGGVANWAVQLEIEHEDGSVEQQIAFEKFREQPFVLQQSGETASGFLLTYIGPSFTEPTLAVMREAGGSVSALFADPETGEQRTISHDGSWPWRFELEGTRVAVLKSYERARTATVRTELTQQETSVPVLVISSDDGEAQLPWNIPTEVTIGGRDVLLEYGPVEVQLPFMLELKDFRKLDYPGVDMAMAFESDVIVTDFTAEDGAGAAPFDFKIHMNHPYKQDGWKVYQSGFLGDSITVFQLTYDPGLIPTYVACSTLCFGIVLIFYSRRLSMGHPGIPAPFTKRRRPLPEPGASELDNDRAASGRPQSDATNTEAAPAMARTANDRPEPDVTIPHRELTSAAAQS